MSTLCAFVLGAIFALGLGISGVVRPEVIRGGLDVTGDFDASLFISFAGALVAYAPLARLARRGTLLGSALELPSARRIDARLMAGSAIFGVGWGLAGTCPGPAVIWLATLGTRALIFIVAMLAGMALHSLTTRRKEA